MRYAGFWMRVPALFIDAIVITTLAFVTGYVLGFLINLNGGQITQEAAAVLGRIIDLGIAGSYFAIMESSEKQATLGKMAMGLKVTDLDGNKIGFGRALGRWMGKLISGIILYIGFFMAGWTEKKQALHDMMAGCVVVIK